MIPRPKILWADDEIELLKPHILFLGAKGYDVTPVVSGVDALRALDGGSFDIAILDENMPGISGLETLTRLKDKCPLLPVIMITKSEEENIMDQAIGSKIADYLIKPVNPSQILLSIKKILHSRELEARTAMSGYREDFGIIDAMTGSASSLADWQELYRRMVRWQLELEAPGSPDGLSQMLASQMAEADRRFAAFAAREYPGWIAASGAEAPLMPHRLMERRIAPALDAGRKIWLIVIDNFRLDQWMSLSPVLARDFTIETELGCALLPTATQYCRNAIFSGLLPRDIAAAFPELWVDEDSPEGKNLNERPLLESFFARSRRNVSLTYTKLNDSASCAALIGRIPGYRDLDLNVVVVNFIDMLSHARTEIQTIRELAATDAAYRSITASWFVHSPLHELFTSIAARSGATIVLTTDHGTVRVDTPVRLAASGSVSGSLRYKIDRDPGVDRSKVIEVADAASFGLPDPGFAKSHIFAKGSGFFAYHNNFNQYARHYGGTFQHGGVSMQEMLVPVVTLNPK